MKTMVEHVERLPSPDRARIGELVPETLWQDVADTGNFAWLAFDLNLGLTRAIAQALGAHRTHDFFVELMLATFKSPLLKSLVDAVLRLKGNDPTVMLPWVSKGFDLMFKDAGTWHVLEGEPGVGYLEVRGLPMAVHSDRIWLDSVASSLSALFTVASVRGVTTIRDVDAERGRATFRLRWEKPA
jgi:hypothetical protein